MKAGIALLCLCVLSAAAAPTKLQICTTAPTAIGPDQIAGCPKKSVAWGPSASTNLIRVMQGTTQKWVTFDALTPDMKVYTGSWVNYRDVNVVLPKVQLPALPTIPAMLHVYVVRWDAVTSRVDGTTLTDLAGYWTRTGPSAIGPWDAWQTVTSTTVSYSLPLDGQHCFQVLAVSQSAGPGDPSTLCGIPAKPATPQNANAN